MAAAAQHLITLEETELLLFLRQNIQRKLAEEAERQGLLVQAVIRYFSLGPMPHNIFNRLVWRLAQDQ